MGGGQRVRPAQTKKCGQAGDVTERQYCSTAGNTQRVHSMGTPTHSSAASSLCTWLCVPIKATALLMTPCISRY